MIQLPAKVSPGHSVTLTRSNKILLPGKCHEENLALSVSQKKKKKIKVETECQRTREQMPGVPLVIININILRAVVLFKFTQDREVVVNNLKTNTEQMSPCP